MDRCFGKSVHVRHAGRVLKTDRLLLRTWRGEDRVPFARMNADPEVMEFFVSPMTREDSDAFVDRIEAGFAECGFGLWAVEEIEAGRFIGFTGLIYQTFQAHFTPAVEIGFRLARHAWGKGYATEAATEAVRYGFKAAGLGEIVRCYTTVSRKGGKLKLINLTKKIQDLLAITKLLTVFETYDSEDEAVRSF